MRTPESIKATLLDLAVGMGLLLGITDAQPFPRDHRALAEREAAGYGSPFSPPGTPDHRTDPGRILAGCKSVIAVAVPYNPGNDRAWPAEGAATAEGWLSRYCRGEDYHRVLHRRLAQLVAFLDQAAPGEEHKAQVDTGPLLERAVAMRAGLGFMGKSTNLIVPGLGTWFFLGSILTTLALPPDTPLTEACGRCTACIDACPTGAIYEPWAVDNNRCLSYVTQMKGHIPHEYREAMGNRLFGCDVCQTVCPYNARDRVSPDPEFGPHPPLARAPSLLSVLAMTGGQFREWFAPTAAGWRGKGTLQRNAAIALGNTGDRSHVPALLPHLRSESATLRAAVAWALGRLGGAEAAAGLRVQLEREQDPEVRAELAAALARCTASPP
jgi:epoxyqueuosine reductase